MHAILITVDKMWNLMALLVHQKEEEERLVKEWLW
jgi:hypothetical protein